MAFFGPGDTPTDEPFSRFAGPMDVASNVQTVPQACWQNLPRTERSFENMSHAAHATFQRVADWWLKLRDRGGDLIRERMQEEFGPQHSPSIGEINHALDGVGGGHSEMFRWLPDSSMAEAFFIAWLLQPEPARDVAKTAFLMRAVLDRQFQTAEHDIAAFAQP
jgi:hypothetical protein